MAPLPVNFFDCLLVAVLVAGLIRGRKNGISQEILRLLKWLMLLFGCAAVYQPLGELVFATGFFDPLSAYLLTYLGTALLIFFLFSILERRLAPKLVGSDAFGRAEYYLGMGSGLLRYACVLLMSLALLNARAFTPGEIKAHEKFQQEAYGSSVFPTLRTLQTVVFEQSLTGPCIQHNLGFLLITPTESGLTALPSTNAPGRLVGK